MLIPTRFTAPRLSIILTLLVFLLIVWNHGYLSQTLVAGHRPSVSTGEHQSQSIKAGTRPARPESPPPDPIPERIWYKTGSKGLTDESRQWATSCLEKNPTHRAEYLTDDSGVAYVKTNFASRPDIIETYLALPQPILQADLLRYLLLFSEGGIWNDLDVSCGDVPIKDWIPSEYRKNTSLVVGWEWDVMWGENVVHQFASWTILAKAGSVHLAVVIDDILEAFRAKSQKYDVSVANLTQEMVGDIVEITGPQAMTQSIFKSLEKNVANFEPRRIAGITKPVLVGDVLVLPGNSFAASNHDGSFPGLIQYTDDDKPPMLVEHHYAGSWKNDKGGDN